MAKQFYECEPCPKSVFGHKFQAHELDNGAVIWQCELCEAVRGFCQHEAHEDSFEYMTPNGRDETSYHYCAYCNQDMSGEIEGERKLSDTDIDQLIEYNEYRKSPLDPRD